jgi:hypothetical protein
LFNQATPIIKALAMLLAFNWIVWSAIAIACGGIGLLGEISGGEFLVRRNPGSTPVSVSASYWFFSLNYSFATFGLTPLAMAILFFFSRPSWDRGVFDIMAISFGFLWLLCIAAGAIPRWFAWAAT